MQAFSISGIRKSYGNYFDKNNFLRDTQISHSGKESDMLTPERKEGGSILIYV